MVPSDERRRAANGRASSRARVAPPRKLPTGIRGLDNVLWGGLPEGRATVVSGRPGTCKTIFCAEFLYRGATEYGEPGVLVTFEEPPENLIRNVAGFGWDLQALVDEGRLAIVDAGIRQLAETEELDEGYTLAPVWVRIRHAVETLGARRVAVDALSSVFDCLGNRGAVRKLFLKLCHELGGLGVTTLVSAEERGAYPYARDADIMQFVADGLIELEMRVAQQQIVRSLTVRKLRGVSYRSGAVDFELDEHGVIVYPKIPIERRMARTGLRRRLSSGVPDLDPVLGGGIPEGHVMLVSGNTGTGKTLLGLHFVRAGLAAGEPAVVVALEESAEQLRRTAAAQGLALKRHERLGRLALIDAPLIDVFTDKLLYDIVNAAQRVGARRLVFDSLSSLESASMNRDDVRAFLSQLVEFTKARGLTSMISFLVPEMLGAEQGQLLAQLRVTDIRLSSLVDGIILLRYVQQGSRIRRLLHVLKLRASRHSTDIFAMTIGHGRITLEPLGTGVPCQPIR